MRGIGELNSAVLKKKYLVSVLVFAALCFAVSAVFVTGRRHTRMRAWENACISTLRVLDVAKERAAAELGLRPGDAALTMDELAPYIGPFRQPWREMVICPSGGTYSVNPIGDDPTCSFPGHSL